MGAPASPVAAVSTRRARAGPQVLAALGLAAACSAGAVVRLVELAPILELKNEVDARRFDARVEAWVSDPAVERTYFRVYLHGAELRIPAAGAGRLLVGDAVAFTPGALGSPVLGEVRWLEPGTWVRVELDFEEWEQAWRSAAAWCTAACAWLAWLLVKLRRERTLLLHGERRGAVVMSSGGRFVFCTVDNPDALERERAGLVSVRRPWRGIPRPDDRVTLVRNRGGSWRLLSTCWFHDA